MNDIIEAVLGLVQAATSYHCSIGSLPANESIAFNSSNGTEDGTFLDKQKVYISNIEIMGKSKNAEGLNEAMWDIHTALTKATVYPKGNGWEILDIESRATPFYSLREQNSFIVYGSSVSVRWHLA